MEGEKCLICKREYFTSYRKDSLRLLVIFCMGEDVYVLLSSNVRLGHFQGHDFLKEVMTGFLVTKFL